MLVRSAVKQKRAAGGQCCGQAGASRAPQSDSAGDAKVCHVGAQQLAPPAGGSPRLVAGGRRVSERFPSDQLSGFTIDSGGAYRQAPSKPSQAKLVGVTMWDADGHQAVVGQVVAQLFGGRS